MPSLTTSLVASLVLLLVVVSLLMWSDAVKRIYARRPLLEFEPRSLVPWGCVDLCLVFLVIAIVETCFASVLLKGYDLRNGLENWSDTQLAQTLLANSVATMVSLILILCLLRIRSKATAADCGFFPDKFFSDIVLGAKAFAMLSVPVYAIQALLTLKYEPVHPIMKLLEGDLAGRYLIAFGAAVVVAPLAEELVFRVILQAWFENVAHYLRGPQMVKHLPSPLQFLFVGRAGMPRVNTAPPMDDIRGTGMFSDQTEAVHNELIVNHTSHWPVVTSSAIFAGMHWGHGPAPIPLFFLALGLGYLYQRTHRVAPCIVTHLMLNGTTLLGIWLSGD